MNAKGLKRRAKAIRAAARRSTFALQLESLGVPLELAKAHNRADRDAFLGSGAFRHQNDEARRKFHQQRAAQALIRPWPGK